MKIAIITLNNPFEKISGGIESVVYNLSKALVNLGHEVWVVCLGNVNKETIEKREGVNVWILPDKGKKGVFSRSLVFIKSGREVIHELEKKGVEVFNGQGGLSAPLMFFKPKKAKIFLTVHTLDDENIANIKDCIRMRKFKELLGEIVKYPLLKIWRIFYLSRADYLIFVSKAVQEEFKRHYQFLKKKYFLVPNGFPNIITIPKLIAKEYSFIYVGRLDKRKCVDLIVKASKILKDRGYDFSVVIIGNGPWHDDIKKLLNDYKLSEHIRLIGFLPNYNDVLVYISKSRFLILPSSYESDPLVIKEALSRGIPCIVSDIPALTEKIKDMENGFVFKRFSHIDLARVMEKTLKLNEKEYQKLSKNAKSSLKGTSWRDIAKKYSKIFIDYR